MKKIPFQALIQALAQQNSIDPALFAALVNQESRFNPNAKSPVGAMGLGQLMPGTARALGVKNPYNPEENLKGSAKYLGQLRKQYGSDEYALAAYNGGPGAVQYFRKHGGIFHNPKAGANTWANQTGNYVQRIMASRGGLRSLFNNIMSKPPILDTSNSPNPLPNAPLPTMAEPQMLNAPIPQRPQQMIMSLIDRQWYDPNTIGV